MMTYKYIGFQTLCDKIRKVKKPTKIKSVNVYLGSVYFAETENFLLKYYR